MGLCPLITSKEDNETYKYPQYVVSSQKRTINTDKKQKL